MRTLHRFHGGVHPEEHKLESSSLPSVSVPVPDILVLPLRQSLGTPAQAIVQTGEKVLKGQLIARADGRVSAALHAPASGSIVAVDWHAVPHASGLSELCITIMPDGEERWIPHAGIDYRALPKTGLLDKLRDGGIVGLGGATFPSHVKFSGQTGIQTLLLNGAECEPWITTDDRLMCERAAEIVQGINILRYLAEPAETLIGIEDNKPQAIAAMQQACAGSGIEVITVPTLYPSGGEKQLIKILTGKEVRSGSLPINISVVCSNVATAYAVHRLINHGEPLISRMITVTGNVKSPQNFEVLLGTSIAHLVKFAGGPLPGSTGYILGGPMMGLHVEDGKLPVVKSTNCVILKSPLLFPSPPLALPCIRCTRCAQVCPAELQPQELYWFAKSKNFNKAKEYDLFDCIECGACTYVCPSQIPLVEYYRFAKSEITAQTREKSAADAARERYNLRLERIEREKREKAEKLALKEKTAQESAKQMAIQPAATPENNAQALIQAALQRAREQAAATRPKNTAQLSPAQQAQISEIELRRANAHKLARQDIDSPKE
jgi:electron transport complex protein RnfC